jgi:hypothetical protein
VLPGRPPAKAKAFIHSFIHPRPAVDGRLEWTGAMQIPTGHGHGHGHGHGAALPLVPFVNESYRKPSHRHRHCTGRLLGLNVLSDGLTDSDLPLLCKEKETRQDTRSPLKKEEASVRSCVMPHAHTQQQFPDLPWPLDRIGDPTLACLVVMQPKKPLF